MIPANEHGMMSILTNASDIDIQPLDTLAMRAEVSSSNWIIPFSPQATLFIGITALIPILMVLAARTWARQN